VEFDESLMIDIRCAEYFLVSSWFQTVLVKVSSWYKERSTRSYSLCLASSFIGSRPARRAELLGALPLHELLTLLTPLEAAFFTMLDAQLDKVESFYLDREKEIRARGRLLQTQLIELNEHRNLVLVCNFPSFLL
jgi:hypothetical protein